MRNKFWLFVHANGPFPTIWQFPIYGIEQVFDTIEGNWLHWKGPVQDGYPYVNGLSSIPGYEVTFTLVEID